MTYILKINQEKCQICRVRIKYKIYDSEQYDKLCKDCYLADIGEYQA